MFLLAYFYLIVMASHTSVVVVFYIYLHGYTFL